MLNELPDLYGYFDNKGYEVYGLINNDHLPAITHTHQPHPFRISRDDPFDGRVCRVCQSIYKRYRCDLRYLQISSTDSQ